MTNAADWVIFSTMKSMHDRIDAALKEKGLSKRAASLAAGGSTHLLQNFFSGESEDIQARGMNTNTLVKLAKELNVSPGWLLTGVGDEEALEICPSSYGDFTDETKELWLQFVRSVEGLDERVIRIALKMALSNIELANAKRDDIGTGSVKGGRDIVEAS